MDEKPRKTRAAKGDDGKEARLKAALKANLARRKAQARARRDGAGADTAETGGNAAGGNED